MNLFTLTSITTYYEGWGEKKLILYFFALRDVFGMHSMNILIRKRLVWSEVLEKTFQWAFVARLNVSLVFYLFILRSYVFYSNCYSCRFSFSPLVSWKIYS